MIFAIARVKNENKFERDTCYGTLSRAQINVSFPDIPVKEFTILKDTYDIKIYVRVAIAAKGRRREGKRKKKNLFLENISFYRYQASDTVK